MVQGGSRKQKWRQNQFLKQTLHLNRLLVKYNIEGIVDLLLRPGRLFYLNFVAGIARGFGIAIGLTVVSALFLALLAKIASLNLPIISQFIARIVQLVNQELPY